MKTSVMIAGVCCLLALSFTLSECAVNCSDFGDPSTELGMCVAELGKGSSSVCEGECRSQLEAYANECVNDPMAAENYKNTFDTLCSENQQQPTGRTSGGIAATGGSIVLTVMTALMIGMAAALNY